jgi:hypothetical protein
MNKSSASSGVATTFGLGAVLGLIEAFVTPRGWLWTVVRGLVFVVFVVFLTFWLIALVRDRRSKLYESRGH